MANYVPFNRVPIATRPWGPAAGVDASIMDDQAAEAERLSLQSMLTANQQGQANLDRYRGETPNVLAKSNLEGMVANDSMSIPGYGRQMGMGAMGDAQVKQATGQTAMDTQASGAQAQNAGNHAKAFQMAGRHLELMAASSPMMAQADYSKFLGMVPEQYRGVLPQQYSPQVPQILNKISESLAMTPEVRGKIAEDAPKLRSQEYVAAGHDMTNYEIAKLKVKQQEEMVMTRWGLKSDDVKRIEQMVVKHLVKKSQGQATTPQEDQAFEAAQQIMYQLKTAGAGMDMGQFRQEFLRPGGNPGGVQSPRPAPPAVRLPSSQDDINMQQQVQQAGYDYEPDKYDYGINPQTGRLARKPKNGR